MPKSFDATTKHLLENHPESWLALIGLELDPDRDVRVINAELSTVTTEADKVLRVGGSEPWLSHFELQASRDPSLARRLLRYNVLLDVRHDLPVQSVAVLLRPEADLADLTGSLDRRSLNGRPYLHFEYKVVRVWREPVESLLRGGLGTLPLAPLAEMPSGTLPQVLRRVGERFRDESSPGEAANLWMATQVLLGLRYESEYTNPLIQGISAMILGIHGIEESSTYQAIFAEGRVEEARRILLRLGTKRFGPPDPKVSAAVGILTNCDRIETLTDRVHEVASWEELLATP